MNNKKEIKYIDLFCGIGGLRIPFEELNAKCVFSSEIDKFSCKTYNDNFGEIPKGDITKININDIPKFNILLAGFPCQAFSIAGKRQGFNDKRGQLFFSIIKILNQHKPECFLLENVKGLLSHDQGKTFDNIKLELEKNGYKIYYKILNAKDFGLPQNRARIYIVGFRENNIKFEFPNKINKESILKDILLPEVSDKYTISDKLWTSHQLRKKKQKEKGNGFGYSLFDPKAKYTSTLSARYYKDGSEILIWQENKNPRKLTPRECARLQGFSDNFKITVSDNQAYKQFGNSVAIPVIREIAKKIIKALEEN